MGSVGFLDCVYAVEELHENHLDGSGQLFVISSNACGKVFSYLAVVCKI